MNKLIHLITTFFALFFLLLNVNLIAQNTPANATHLFSLTEGMSAPFRLAINSSGTIYITDVNQHNVVKYDHSFDYVGSIDVGNKPSAIAINSSNEVFVGDSETGTIYKLDADENATEFSTIINSASSMVFDNNDLLYVVDSKLRKIRVLDTDGTYLHSIGEDDFIYPTAITYDSENDRLFVAEHGGLNGGFFGSPDVKVWIYDTDGNNLGSFGSTGTDEGQFMKIQGMAVRRTGNIYVVDQSLSNINIFEEDQSFVNEFGEYGTVPGKLNLPMDITFDNQERTIVSSMSSGSVEVYYVNEINPTYEISAVDQILCPGETTDIHVDFTGVGPWTFTYTLNGQNPITVTNTSVDPYIFTVSDTGLYEITSMRDSRVGCVDYSSKVQIYENPVPSSAITSGDIEICGGDSIMIPISLTGAAPWNMTYTDGLENYTVNNIQTSPHILNVNTSGTYEVTYLEGAGGCVANTMTGSVNVFVNELKAEMTNLDTVICESETVDIPITFTGTAPWTFTYSIDGIDQAPITTNNNPYLLSANDEGYYAITAVSNSSGTSNCFNGSASLTVHPLPVSHIISPDTVICEGESTDIIIELTGTAPWDLTYTVDGINPVTVENIHTNFYTVTGKYPGLYEVIALSDKNCTGIDFNGSIKIQVNPLPTSTILEGNDQYMISEGESKDFTVELTGTAPWSYTYVIDDKNPTTEITSNSTDIITAFAEGTYDVIEIKDNNCTNNKSIGYPEIVFDPSPTATITSGIDTIICEGDSAIIQIELTGTGPWNITYTKDGINPVDVSTINEIFTLAVSEAGLYEVSSVSDANGTGTRINGSTQVTVNPLPNVNLGADQIFCEGITVTLDAGTHSSYLWSDGSTTQTLDVNTTGTYSVNVTDVNGCESADEITITINPLPTVNLGTDQTFCEGNTVTLDAGIHSSYLWSDGSSEQTLDVNTSGSYYITVTNEYDCENTDEVMVIVYPLPVSDFTFTDNNLEVTFINSSVHADSYLWNFGDSNSSTESDPVHTYSSSGSYEVTLIASSANCGDSIIAKTLDVITTSMNEIPIEDTINIYPNPSDGIINIDLNSTIEKRINVSVINSSGYKIYSDELEFDHNKQQINLTHLPSGIYSIVLFTNDREESKIIIIAK